jgi:hypothetical protein
VFKRGVSPSFKNLPPPLIREGDKGGGLPKNLKGIGLLKLIQAAQLRCLSVFDLQQREAALFFSDTLNVCAGYFIQDDLSHQPGGDAGAQAPGHGAAGASQGSVNMQDRPPIFTGGEHTHPHQLVGAVNGQEHRFRGHFIRAAGADDDLTFTYATHQDYMSDRYSFLLCETLNTPGQHIPILQPDDKNPPYLAFSCFH